MGFARGFKTRCENIAEGVRRELGLSPYSVLNMGDLSHYLGVRLITPDEVSGLSKEARSVLLGDESADWSAVTVGEAPRIIIIHNPLNSAARRASDLSHEMSHLLLRHKPSTVVYSGDLAWTLRSFDDDQEAEATWLAGCLLLPRAALIKMLGDGSENEDIAKRYGVSLQMVRYRRGVTGVDRQLARRT